MIAHAKWSRLRQTEWWEYAVRFVFGGVVTVLAGTIAKRWGPVAGGLFLAFPGIFPAGVTLTERHERDAKRRRGLSGTKRGRLVAGVVAAGAALGAFGLVAFGAAAAWLLPRVAPWLALLLAAVAWLAVSVLVWDVRLKARMRRRRRERKRASGRSAIPARRSPAVTGRPE
jgi:hypothetical protein